MTVVLPATIEGNALPFSPAYNVDNLLFKHVVPTLYDIEGSVINAIYARVYANMKLSDNLGFTPQVLFAWNDETSATSAFDGTGGFGGGIPGVVEVEKYLGTEIEGTLSWTLHPGVNLDFIGSVVLAGDGLTDLLEAQRGRWFHSRGYDLGVPDKADGLHRSVREIKTNQSSQSLNEAGSLTKVARFFFCLFAGRGKFSSTRNQVFSSLFPINPRERKNNERFSRNKNAPDQARFSS